MNTEQKHVVKLDNDAYFTMVKERLDKGSVVKIPVVGKSMEPFLREKDEVLLCPVTSGEVVIGDIVLAKWGQRYVLHRIVRKKADVLWLAGDNNLAQIEKVGEADLLAVLCEAWREEKFLPVSRKFNKILGLLWYYLRLPRRIVVAIKRRGNTFFRP